MDGVRLLLLTSYLSTPATMHTPDYRLMTYDLRRWQNAHVRICCGYDTGRVSHALRFMSGGLKWSITGGVVCAALCCFVYGGKFDDDLLMLCSAVLFCTILHPYLVLLLILANYCTYYRYNINVFCLDSSL
ncbi:hypothetical protein B0I75DRAFT_137022, partial [Yarrowia lipolytica]